MDASAFLLQGILLGLAIAAPIGPMGMLCIRRTLVHGMLHGFLTGAGTATADALYGGVAAFGVTAVTAFLLDQRLYLHLLGGLFLLYLGYSTFKAVPASAAARTNGTGLAGAYLSALGLTLTNPMTIMSFAAVFAGLGVGSTGGDYKSAGAMVLGVFTGSLLWWLTLSGVVCALRTQCDQRRLTWVNRLSGLIIAGFGVISLTTL